MDKVKNQQKAPSLGSKPPKQGSKPSKNAEKSKPQKLTPEAAEALANFTIESQKQKKKRIKLSKKGFSKSLPAILAIVFGAICLIFVSGNALQASEAKDIAASTLPFAEKGFNPYLWVLGAWGAIFGNSELSLRALSAIFGATSLILGFYLMKNVLGFKKAAIFGGILAVAMPFFDVWTTVNKLSLIIFVTIVGLSIILFASNKKHKKVNKKGVLAIFASLAVLSVVWSIFSMASRTPEVKNVLPMISVFEEGTPLLLVGEDYYPQLNFRAEKSGNYKDTVLLEEANLDEILKSNDSFWFVARNDQDLPKKLQKAVDDDKIMQTNAAAESGFTAIRFVKL